MAKYLIQRLKTNEAMNNNDYNQFRCRGGTGC